MGRERRGRKQLQKGLSIKRMEGKRGRGSFF